jgi:hypothetical protein
MVTKGGVLMPEELPLGLSHVFAQTKLHVDNTEYVIVSFALDQVTSALFLISRLGVPFSSAVVDKDEVTLLLPWDSWYQVRDEADARGEARGYRLITFDIPTDLGLVGFIATFSGVLAEAGIGIYSTSAFTRDHVMVQEEDLDRAVQELSGFIERCKANLDAQEAE